MDETLAWNFGQDVGPAGRKFLAPLDVTDPDELQLMVATEGAIASETLTIGGKSIRESLIESAVYAVGDYAHLVQLHGLVLERLRNARPEISPVQLAEWRAREAELAKILDAVVEGRRRERERILSGDTDPPKPPWEAS